MVSLEYRCIFVHVPKCAGTSVESDLGHFELYDGRGRQDHRPIAVLQPITVEEFLVSGQARAAWLRKMKRRVTRSRNPKNDIWPDHAQYREFFKFTVVRSPWGRLRSMYRNLLRDPTHAFLRGETVPEDFSTFVERWAGVGLMRPMRHWLVDRNGDVPFDEIIEFEELEFAWPRVARQLGLPSDELSHENHGARSADVDLTFSEAARRHVLMTYAWEFAYFGYSETPA